MFAENVENSTNSISTEDPNSVSTCGPIILLVQQRIGGGRRKRVQTPFPSAFKIQPLLPKPPSSNDIPVINASCSIAQVEENGSETLINSVQNENFDEQPIVVNIDAEEEVFVCAKLREDVAVGTDPSSVVTCEIECQTDSFVTDGRSKFVDRGASPCIFENEQIVSNPRKYPKINVNNSDVKNNKPVPKKPRTDAISEIVNFIVDMPDKELSNIIGFPATVNGKNVQQRSRRSSNAVCAPSLLRVEDILQPVVGSTNMAGYSNPSSNAAATRTMPYSNKRSSTLTSKLSSKRPENVDKHSLAANCNSSSSWREFLPNFSQIFPSYCPPAAPPPSKVPSDVVNSSSNKRNTFKTDSSVGNFHHIAADFSIESIQNGSEMNKIRSASQAQKNAAAKLSHFPCSSSNSSVNAPNVSSSMPLPYSDIPMFLPCFPHPPNFNESKNKSKRSDAISLSSSVNNPLIPTDGSQEVNLSNSIFDMQGNNGVNCGSFVPPYHTGQPVNFYNFSSSKMPSSNITVTSEDRSADSQSIAWQWSDHGFSSQNYSQSLDSTQTSGQKGQNFHIAAMFPEATTPLTNSTTAHLSPSYRWNEPRLSNDHGGGSSMPSASAHHYSSHNEPSSWAPPQLRSYNNHDRTSNSFMPSFNFSQPNSHN